ncbi:SDR family NAD(P)-dependent oxidoreductase [Nocardia brasiliensis]
MNMTEQQGDSGCALVVGAAGGIGGAVADRLAAAGRDLALLDRDGAALAVVGKQIRANHGADCRVTTHVADIGSRAEVERAVDDIERQHGPVGALACTAGVLYSGPLTDIDVDAVQRMIEVNIVGVLHLLATVGGRMKQRRRGSIVVIGSNAGAVPRLRIGVYGATKAAATLLTRVAALELAPYGVRANVVAPGSTDTPMLRALYPSEDEMVRHAVGGSSTDFRLGIPLGRLAQASDIAAAVHFLLSDAARHITMQTLYVDGGATLHD